MDEIRKETSCREAAVVNWGRGWGGGRIPFQAVGEKGQNQGPDGRAGRQWTMGQTGE